MNGQTKRRTLRPIPKNTVVHTPTEAEAKELLAILHENGYTWCGGSSLLEESEWKMCKGNTCYYISQYVEYGPVKERNEDKTTLLTLAEFKERYVLNEDNFAKSKVEKPQPKFKVGDKAIVATNTYGLKGVVGGVCEITEVMPHGYHIISLTGEWFVTESDLEPYTEPETKEETMETKEKQKGEKGNNSENSQLDLCELLKGHEGESIFLTTMGEVLVEKVSEEHLFFRLRATEPGWRLNANGKMSENGVVITYPSRALYEQYPLDPYTAWMKWQEEQKKFGLDIKIETYFEGKYGWEDCDDDVSCLHFRTPADRDKCIEEIKAIIEKYSKK